MLFYLCCTSLALVRQGSFLPDHSRLMLSVRQPAIHKCTFLLCGCLHRNFTHNDLWHNSILQQSTAVCHLLQKEIVNVKSTLLADTFITTPNLNSCCKTHDLTVTVQLTQPVVLLSPIIQPGCNSYRRQRYTVSIFHKNRSACQRFLPMPFNSLFTVRHDSFYLHRQ